MKIVTSIGVDPAEDETEKQGCTELGLHGGTGGERSGKQGFYRRTRGEGGAGCVTRKSEADSKCRSTILGFGGNPWERERGKTREINGSSPV